MRKGPCSPWYTDAEINALHCMRCPTCGARTYVKSRRKGNIRVLECMANDDHRFRTQEIFLDDRGILIMRPLDEAKTIDEIRAEAEKWKGVRYG